MEGLVLGLGKWLGLGYMEKRESEDIPGRKRKMYGSLRKTNQLYRSKASNHPFCINAAFTMWGWEVVP